ncbi:hypothetical protein LTR86_001054 [Recurvomyces mirabilis]|nr:hypothetical protein LTR86_001054 [Recurvomyces mirabilis]
MVLRLAPTHSYSIAFLDTIHRDIQRSTALSSRQAALIHTTTSILATAANPESMYDGVMSGQVDEEENEGEGEDEAPRMKLCTKTMETTKQMDPKYLRSK